MEIKDNDQLLALIQSKEVDGKIRNFEVAVKAGELKKFILEKNPSLDLGAVLTTDLLIKRGEQYYFIVVKEAFRGLDGMIQMDMQ